MIEVYHGEFLVSPCPLELSLNYCSHSCAVCFANLNSPSRRANVKAILRLLQSFESRNTFVSQLLRERRPVLMSNKVDPFATSNYQQTLPILEVLTQLQIPVAFQTRGGRGVDEAIGMVPPSVWYISINQGDDTLRAKLEPNAPALDSRYELMERLSAAGHRVVLGLNPLVPEWVADAEPILTRAMASGASGVWIERLHLNWRQVANMSEAERAAVTQPILKRAQKKRLEGVERERIFDAYEAAAGLGLEIYSGGQPFYSRFFDPYHELYAGKTFPTFQDWINYCYEAPAMWGTLISFEEFAEFFCSKLPEGVLPIDSYLGAKAHDLWHHFQIPPQMSFRNLLAFCWREPRTKRCPAAFPSFAFAGVPDGDGWNQVVDESGMPYMVFSPEGFDEWWVPVETVKEAA